MKIILGLFVSASAFNVIAQNSGQHLQNNTVTTAFPFLMYAPDGRSGGLGEVGAALSPSASSFHWNTANIGFSKNKAAVNVTYIPWLRQLIDDIDYMNVSGFSKLGLNSKHSVGGSAKYLSSRNNNYFMFYGTKENFKINELELLGGYSYRVSNKSSVGANAKFIYSDLLQKLVPDSISPGSSIACALDLSYGYVSDNITLGEKNSTWAWGVSIVNLGNKVLYSDPNNGDFLPANLRVGTAYKLQINQNHGLELSLDANKLMVPNQTLGTANISAIEGVFRSFADSPDGFVGELREITIGTGIEYKFKELVSLRTGYFFEHHTKSNRRFVTIGAGLNYKSFGIDASYLASVTRNNPIANTMRFSVNYSFKKKT